MTSQAPIWNVLLPVIVGGVIALLAGVVAPVLNHFLNSRTARRLRREERFEALITATYEHHHWLDEKRGVVVYGGEKSLPPPAMPKALTISMIHFPQLTLALRKLDLACTHYEAWMSKAAGRRVAGKIPEINEGFTDAYKAYGSAFIEFQSAAEDFAKRELRRS